MISKLIIAAASAAVLTLSTAAFAQKAGYGTADEAKAMLLKAVAALKANKANTLDLINEGPGAGSSTAISMYFAPQSATAKPARFMGTRPS